MSALPVAATTASAFLAASLLLAVTPGPGVLFIVARSLAHGRAAGLASVAGVALGNLGNVLGTSLGLAALFAVSATAFTAVRLAGAAYLVWLGVEVLRGARAARPAPGGVERPALRRVVRDGALVALLNPKTTLFFAAFLPQFIDPAGSAIVQSVLFGVTFVAIAATTDTVYVLTAVAAAATLRPSARTLRAGRYASAATFIGLGLVAAASGGRPGR